MPGRNVNMKVPLLFGFLQGINISFTNQRQKGIRGKTKTTKIWVYTLGQSPMAPRERPSTIPK